MKQSVFALVIALLATIFAIQNAGTVTVNLFFWDFSMSLALLIICLLLIGISVGFLLMSRTVMQKNTRIKSLEKKINSELPTLKKST